MRAKALRFLISHYYNLMSLILCSFPKIPSTHSVFFCFFLFVYPELVLELAVICDKECHDSFMPFFKSEEKLKEAIFAVINQVGNVLY